MSDLLSLAISSAGLTKRDKNTSEGRFLSGQPVEMSADLQRILDLPQRNWQTDYDLDELVQLMTAHLRKPNGKQTLFPVQAVALLEFADNRRGSVYANVGVGKTVCAALAPVVLEAKRPLIITFAKLLNKEQRDFRELAKHWRIPLSQYRYRSVESIVERKRGSANHVDFLDSYKPDVIICDEVHAFARTDSARSRRLRRYLKAYPETVFIGLTGTPGDKSLARVAELQRLSFGKTYSPYPTNNLTMRDFQDALDVDVIGRRKPLGALEAFGGKTVEEARQAVGEHASRVPGNVWLRGSSAPGSSLYLDAEVIDTCDFSTSKALDSIASGAMPDGRPFEDALYEHLVTRQVALGFSKLLSPSPPKAWRDARNNWYALCRDIAKRSGAQVESPMQVANLIARGELDDMGLLNEWRKQEPSFKASHVVEWHSLEIIELCAKWLREHKGLVWTPFPDFGIMLEQVTGVPFFRNMGNSARHGNIEDWKAGKGAILSVAANKEGRNLQRFNENLIVSPLSSSDELNQVLGRTHRFGQEAESVGATFILAHRENLKSLLRARERAKFDADLNRDAANKLLTSDWLIQDEAYFDKLKSKRWVY